MSIARQGSEVLPTPFDRVTALVCAALEVPFGLLSVLEDDKALFRAVVGLDQKSVPRDVSVSARLVAMGPDATLVIPDALDDPELRNHPMVTDGPRIRFFAGATICDASGTPVGAVGAMDVVPREHPTPPQMAVLRHAARLAGDLFDQVQASRVQAEQLALLRLAEEMAGLGPWRLDLANGKVDWSDEVYRIHGRDPATFDPGYADVLSDYHPEDREILAACVERAIETGQGYNLELRLVSATCGERRVLTRARTEVGEDGRPFALFGVFQDVTETVLSQERLKSGEALFRMMSETATDVIARYRPDGTFLYLSPSVETILGYRPDQLVGRLCREFIPPEDIPAIDAVMRAYFRAGPGAPPPRYEYRAIRADGTTVWLEASPRAVWDEAGRTVLELHDHVRDVTARKAAERVQAELVETLGMAEELGGVGCWRLDVASGVVTWSDEVYRIHGKSRETFDPTLDDAVGCYHPDDRQTVADCCARAIKTGEGAGFQLRLIRDDGDERIVTSQCRPERDETGATTALFGVFRDVTDVMRSQQRIEASEARYRLLADRASDVIVTYGVDGLIGYISPSVEAATGISPDDLLGRSVTHLILEEDVPALAERLRDMVKAPAGEAMPGLIYRARVSSGDVRWMEARTTLIRDPAGRVIEFQDVVRDITETKRLEEALITARDTAEAGARAKSEFLANMSHELRTPLTSVIGFSGLLQASVDLPETERKYADRIATASDALLSVINDILDYSKLEADAVGLDAQAFDPRAMASAAAAMVEDQCEKKGLKLALEVEAGLPSIVLGDEGRLRQVTLNFLSNAVKFTGAGEVRLAISMIGGRIRVAVSDTGIGISPDKIDQLFERFTQGDSSTTRVYGGTGLGLAISRRLIDMMGGEIGAESLSGEGSTFWFEVPVIEGAMEAVAPEVGDAVLPRGLRILMADDVAANRELGAAIMGALGIALDTVADGSEAVEAAREGGYDLILMDVHMPVMDGLDATRAIRGMGGAAGDVPIVALTANVQPGHIARCREAGMDGHVGKPIQVSVLVATMTEALNHARDERRANAA
ncbi:PAS domain-containing protein [Brevundimonas sp.]|uniref:PAS domain-containing protein n=1 Tax=Brevundimonas sp. TaxID=1871086 RepID=UPI003565EA67